MDEFIENEEYKNYKNVNKLKYVNYIPDNLQLDDLVIVYNDGRQSKIYSLNFLLSHPIIYEKYYMKDNVLDITLTHCPISKSTIIYFGEYEITKYKFNNNIVICKSDNKENKVVQLSGNTYDENNDFIESNHMIYGTKLVDLRSAIVSYPDAMFYKYDKNDNNEIFYNNNDKQIIYGVYYLSKNGDKKQAVLMGKQNEKFNYNKMGFNKYFDSMNDKFREKSSTVIPCYLLVWKLFYPDSKIINMK